MPMGGTELLIILAIVLLFFGAKRVPRLGRSLGQGMREFRRGVSEDLERGREEDGARQLPEGESREKASPSGSASRGEEAKAPRSGQGLQGE